MTVYGLANCDTTKAAIKFLKKNHQDFDFYDFKTLGVSQEQLEKWLSQISIDRLLNKQSTTWRSLSVGEQQTASTTSGAVALLVKHTSLIKRPLVAWNDGTVTVGFKETAFEDRIAS